MKMMYSTTLEKELEKWWKHLDRPFSIMESCNDVIIGSVNFRPWGNKHWYYTKTKCTATYIRTFQSIDPVENSKGEIIYPILDVYVDICNGRKQISYKKVRCRCCC